MKRRTNIIQIAMCLVLCALLIAGCSSGTGSGTSQSTESAAATESAQTETSQAASSDTAADTAEASSASGTAAAAYTPTAYAEIKIEGYDPITVGLDANAAPKTVENFINLAESGFYDGLTFHRIMNGFMMQGGDPNGNGSGGSDTNVEGEFAQNGVNNPLSHTRGAISMARSQDFNSGSSQFFIVHEDSQFLDGQYAAFGYVEDGIEVVDEICTSAQPTDSNGSISPDQQPVIETITIREA